MQCCKVRLVPCPLLSRLLLDLYYEAFPNDRLWTKCLVYGTYTLELTQTILIMHDAFVIFGTGFGDLEALIDAHFLWFSVPVMSGIGMYPVEKCLHC